MSGLVPSAKPDNFSYEFIIDGKTVRVRVNQQMIVYRAIDIEGELDLEGSLVIIDV